jgi:hypothetical protein
MLREPRREAYTICTATAPVAVFTVWVPVAQDGGFPGGAGGARPMMMGGMGTSADAGDAPAGQGPTPCLPEPTGPCPVGTTSLHLTDTSRPDPWAAGRSHES